MKGSLPSIHCQYRLHEQGDCVVLTRRKAGIRTANLTHDMGVLALRELGWLARKVEALLKVHRALLDLLEVSLRASRLLVLVVLLNRLDVVELMEFDTHFEERG